LTPHIIDDPEETKGDFAVDEIDRKQTGVRENLQLIDRRKNIEILYDKAAVAYLDGEMEASMKYLDEALRLCPTNQEARRLQERIIAETDPDAYERLERIVRDEIVWQEHVNQEP
jgi:hypothetical protein